MMQAPQQASVRMQAVDYDPFAGGVLARVVPTTEPQREIWLAAHMDPQASLSYNESVTLQLRGELAGELLLSALRSVLERHDALRSTFGPDGETFCVLESMAAEIGFSDLCALEPAQRDDAVRERLRAGVETPFVLERGPLFRAELLRVAADEHLLLMHAHHVVCDGWSWWLLVRELGHCYAQLSGRAVPPLPAAESFADYAEALARNPASAESAQDEAYWLSRFSGSIPVLDLPLDHARPAVHDFSSRRLDRVLDAELVSGLRRLGARRGISLFATLLGAYASLLSRLSGQEEVVVGIPAAGQSVGGYENLVGHCVNLLPLRFAPGAAGSFEQLLGQAQEVLLDALEHQQYTFGTLLKKLRVARDPARTPLVSAVFNIDQTLEAEQSAFPGLELDFLSNPRSYDNFEFSINAAQFEGKIRLECQYSTALFDASTIEQWLATFEALLRAVVQDPGRALDELPLGADAAAGLGRLQPPRLAFDRECRMHEHFERQHDLAPERIAIRAPGLAWKYAELEQRANRVAHRLRAHGIGQGSLVGLAMERSPQMLAALLGVLKAGAAYVPLDPAFPAERLLHMVHDARLSLVICDQASATVAGGLGRPLLLLDESPAAEAHPASRIGRDALAAGPESVAYVIYTSGSTGKPKGVEVPHRAVANLLEGLQREFNLERDDRLAAVMSLSFDPSVIDLLLPLRVGAEIVMVDRATVVDGVALAKLLEETRANVMQSTPSGWRLLLEAGWQGAPGFKVICGGEPMSADLASALLARCQSLWNVYGPTETTVISTCARITAGPGAAPDVHIGKPILNTQVWVLDAHGRPCPQGVYGELYIGGEGVALGYLQRPELTAERFIADHFADHLVDRAKGCGAAIPAPRLYRTGDRGRWRADGNLQCDGRIDSQVKVRGYRIELGEIEAVIAADPAVARTAVAVREDRPGDVRLVAYVVPRAGAPLDPEALLASLRGKLPEYMVPRQLVTLAQMPLLPNGKADLQRLPAPEQSAPAVAQAPAGSSAVQVRLTELMSAVLGGGPVGVDDDFFAIGGHSLLGMRLVARINQEFGGRIAPGKITLRELFDAPSAARLASLLAEPAPAATDAVSATATATVLPAAPFIPRLDDQGHAPLSLMQQRLWVQEQMQPGLATYNIPGAHRLRGRLDLAALQQALASVVQRQSSLRTEVVVQGDTAIQRVHEHLSVTLPPVEDLSQLPAPAREAELMARLGRRIAEPIPMDRAPLFRIGLYRLAEHEHVLFFMVHHVIWDGLSFDLFLEELGQAYALASAGRPCELPAPSISYGDFAAWHLQQVQGEGLRPQLEFWKRKFAGGVEPLALPEDYPRPALGSGSGGSEALRVDAALTARLRKVGLDADASLFMTLLAAYYALLQRMSGQSDLVVGLPVRNHVSDELDKVLGFFANILPLRVQVDPALSFGELVGRVRAEMLDAFAHPDIPLEHLVNALHLPRDPSRTPVYQAIFTLQDVRGRSERWGELTSENIELAQSAALTDLSLWMFEAGDGLVGDLNYNADIISSESATAMRQRFLALLRQFSAHPQRPIGDADALHEAERNALQAWNATATEVPRQHTLHALLKAQAARTPERPALRFDGVSISYAQLEARAERLAAALAARGVGQGDLVGICLEREQELLPSLLAVLKAGAAYVPLDPAYPAERLRFMVEDAGLAMVVSRGGLADDLGCPRERLLLLDADQAQIEAAPPLAAGVDEPDLRQSRAYVIYTSGSTGKPKGVQVQHGAVLNFLHSMARQPGLEAQDRLLAITTTSFDISVLELFLPLSVGAEVVLASREAAMEGREIAALLARENINVMQATPATWRMLIESGWSGGPAFKALCGGEPLPQDLAVQLLGRCGELWNMYGPTETTVWSTCARVEAGGQGQAPQISIGTPIANTTVWVLDSRGRPCPTGVAGEIHIGGAGVTLGYLGRPQLTAEKFIADPFSDAPGARLYRTGDLGRWSAAGVLQHLGRLDFQIKIRGYRIELEEIERNIADYPGIARVVAMAREDVPGDQRLVAYVVTQDQGELDESGLLGHLRALLPAYMLPQHLVRLPAIPLLPNGKVDRKSLPAPAPRAAVAAAGAVSDPRVAADARIGYLVDVWSSMLGTTAGPDDNFFDLGGHSMLAVQLANRVHRDTGVRVRLMALTAQTLAQLAAELPPMDGLDANEEAAAHQPTSWYGRMRRAFARAFGAGKQA